MAMISGTWGAMTVGGWLVMLVFWSTFLGLVVWALASLFPPVRARDPVAEQRVTADRGLAPGEGRELDRM